ncbi:MAG: hypothetical protein KZQ89_19325 [Candidatus Thiodiazotropha sp. (ex Lucinoma kastoroae)]|nr:hypothetical protein [Candidatus Thiodiazotropha sp. (ex Lucinoma kastoroae)]
MTFKSYFNNLILLVFLSGCVTVPKPTVEERKLLKDLPVHLKKEMQILFPSALRWYKETELSLYEKGRILTKREVEVAYELGVKNPHDVRVIILNTFPMPTDKRLLKKAKGYGLGSKFEDGRTMGNLIILKPRYKNDSVVLTHELVHVAQKDRMGREALLKRYILELEVLGYSRSDIEHEAYEKQRKIK